MTKTKPDQAADAAFGQLLWRGQANAWECDEMGHLNVRAYAMKATEALHALARQIGMSNLEDSAAVSALCPREILIRFLAEARPGAPLDISGGVSRVDEDSLTAVMEMRHGDRRPAAGFTITADHVETASGAAFPWAARIRAAAEALEVAPPAHAGPRGTTTTPPTEDASLARADALDLLEIGRGVFLRSDCDAFGRVRIDTYQGRVSDSASNLFRRKSGAASETNLGGALLESRIIVHAEARGGDPYVIRSGIAEISGKVWRVVHWFLDPFTGAHLASMEGAGVHFDLKARKAIAPSAEILAELERFVRPEIEA
jgi:acyl-CoA thioester hydrolase